MRTSWGLIVLGILAAAGGQAVRGGGTVDWDFLDQLDTDQVALIQRYAAAAEETHHLPPDLAWQFPSPLLELEIHRDFKRLRWRGAQNLPGNWTEALVCPEDRPFLRRVEGVAARASARGPWIKLALEGDRLVTSPAWKSRALLIRPDGKIVRLMVLE